MRMTFLVVAVIAPRMDVLMHREILSKEDD
jgi:hypothetical protein